MIESVTVAMTSIFGKLKNKLKRNNNSNKILKEKKINNTIINQDNYISDLNKNLDSKLALNKNLENPCDCENCGEKNESQSTTKSESIFYFIIAMILLSIIIIDYQDKKELKLEQELEAKFRYRSGVEQLNPNEVINLKAEDMKNLDVRTIEDHASWLSKENILLLSEDQIDNLNGITLSHIINSLSEKQLNNVNMTHLGRYTGMSLNTARLLNKKQISQLSKKQLDNLNESFGIGYLKKEQKEQIKNEKNYTFEEKSDKEIEEKLSRINQWIQDMDQIDREYKLKK